MKYRRLLLWLFLPWLLLAVPHTAQAAPRPASERQQRQARQLADKALEHLRRQDVEGRQMAIAELEQATRLEPANADYQLMLARTLHSAGYIRAARQRYDRVVALVPADAAAHFGLAQVWRRDWLKYLDTGSLRRSIGALESAVAFDSTMTDAWLMLSCLRVESRDTLGAAAAAARARAVAPSRAEAQLAVASTAWRMGDVATAEAAFRACIPRLPTRVRARFEDLAPLTSEADTIAYNRLDAAGRREFERRFWTEHDPDLATPENEAQMEYWARVAQAFFLFYDAKRREWDERGEVYVRYGPPERLDYNPLEATLYSRVGISTMQYPMNVLVWAYPRLGMTVTLQDRQLNEFYLLPMTRDHDPDPRPDPDSLARLGLVETHELRGVFPVLPPRTQPVRIEGQVACFEGLAAPHVFAALEVESPPGESLLAQCVVLDSTEREVMRTSRPLSPSACEASRFRVADFAADVPPGRYRVGLSVRGGLRRGSARLALTVPRPDSALRLSDLVVTCGAPLVPEPGVRLDPNPLARVPAGAPLSVYFEVYGLAPAADGQARFEYVYSVRSRERDPRPWIQRAVSPRPAAPTLEASRRETNVGSLRRQFVNVPVQSLPPGRYRIEIQVRDLVSGEETRGAADFVHLAAVAR